MPTQRHRDVYETFLRHRSLTLAAEELGVSKQYVHQCVRRVDPDLRIANTAGPPRRYTDERIREVLALYSNRASFAAAHLDISPGNLYMRMSEMGIPRRKYAKPDAHDARTL